MQVHFLALLVFAVLLQGHFNTASAQESNGVRVNGSVSINATGQNLTNQASNGSVADMGVGRIGAGTHVGGDIAINAHAQNLTNKADRNSKACLEVGTVGKNACQK